MASPIDIGFHHLWDKIKAIFQVIGQFLLSFFNAQTGILNNVERIITAFQETETSIKDSTDRLKNFEFNVQWKTRVIHVPTAIDKFRDLYIRLFTDVKEKLHKIALPFFEFKTNFGSGKGTGGDQGVLDPTDHVSGLTRASVKVELTATLIAELANAFEQIADWTKAIDQLIIDIETLDDAFLQQKNPRRLETKKGSFRIP